MNPRMTLTPNGVVSVFFIRAPGFWPLNLPHYVRDSFSLVGQVTALGPHASMCHLLGSSLKWPMRIPIGYARLTASRRVF